MKDAVERFSQLKSRRDGIQNQYIAMQGKLESAKEGYQAIMQELQGLGIGSLDELNAKILELESMVNDNVDSAHKLMDVIEEKMHELDSEKVGVAVNGRESE
ncbi:MAG TPA: hypothetical protein ENI23_08125 [bacterium]|nr:hypothetical protein [bacterium]